VRTCANNCSQIAIGSHTSQTIIPCTPICVGRFFSRGGPLVDFSKNFSRGAKVVRFAFSHSNLRKQPFLAANFKIQGPGPLRCPCAHDKCARDKSCAHDKSALKQSDCTLERSYFIRRTLSFKFYNKFKRSVQT